jgi:4-amino-4-deoxy-L-arabinose transferase-like glycosyltransferase
MTDKDKKTWQWTLGLVAGLYVLLSVATIEVYQVPWFDEVYYTDAAWSFATNGGFSVPVDYPRTSGESLHSPLFSVVQAGMFKLCGLGIWQARLLPLLSGIALFLLFSRMIFRMSQSGKYTLLFMLLWISDRALNFNMHSGRMDMLAVLLTVLSMLLFERALKWKALAWSMVGAAFAGLLLSAGCLTALRIAIAAIPCVLLLFLYKPERRAQYYYCLVAYGLMAALPLICWLWIAYGGVTDAYATKSSSSGFALHFGFLTSLVENVFRRTNEIPKMLMFYGAMAYLFTAHRDRVRRNFLFCMYALISLGFILFVIENGPYRAMFFPFVYLALVFGISSLKHPLLKKAGFVAAVGLLAINSLFSLPRMIYLALNFHGLNYAKVAAAVAENIPRGSRVSADYKFYYALRANGCDVVIPCMGTDELADYILTKFRPEYILGREQALNGRFTNKTVVVSTIGVKPVDVPGWLDRFIRLERLMPENNFYTDIKKVE